MAAEAASITREYALSELMRLRDVLIDSTGSLHATFAFSRLAGARVGVTVSINTGARLQCQRCLQAFDFAVDEATDIEVAANQNEVPIDSEREFCVMTDGTVSLRDLAEEELILALPIVAACDTPDTCGNAPATTSNQRPQKRAATVRPFAGLQDLLKKT
jgi:uncharacterized protein